MAMSKIIVVEDERIVALHMKQQLMKLGYDVVAVVASGEKALKAINELHPDVVLMDIHIEGDLDGIDVAARIKSGHTPIIYLSAYSEEATLERARATKPYGYLVKPFSERELHATIQMALERHRADLALIAAERRLGKLNKQLQIEIAERTKAQHEIVKERDTAQRYMDVAGVIILVLNPDATIRLINRHGCQILGHADSNEIVGKSWIDCFIPERLREPLRESYRRLIHSGDAGAEFEFYTNAVVTKFGDERIVAWHNALLKDDHGVVSGCLSSGDDITERLRVEENLRSSEERFRSIFSAVGEGIFIVDVTNGTITEVNEPGAAMYGYTPDEMIGLPVDGISSGEPPYTQVDAARWIERAAVTGKTQQFDWHGKRKDGSLLWAEVSIRFAFISGKKVALSIARDVTQRRAMEAQLRQALKLEAIGTLAGGVAHELNNLLQPIIMMTELALTELPEDSPQISDLNRVVDAGGKAAEIVQRILAFGRADEGSHTPLDIAVVVREALSFARTILPSTITLEVETDEGIGMVQGDKTQLTQVLINLATNARDAIGANVGAVRVQLSKTTIAADAAAHGLKPGDYALLKVRDTGVGMDQATAQRIFEPFFTTKGVGKGTGLGLSVTHGIVTGHGGAIRVDSASGKGTMFSIHLPIADPEIAPALTR